MPTLLCFAFTSSTTEGDRYFNDIVQRAAKLICTTPEFDKLAPTVGLGSHQQGVTNETQRAQLRAELDSPPALCFKVPHKWKI